VILWKKKARRREGKRSQKGRKKWRQGDSKEVGTTKILEMEESIWKERVRKNASVKGLGLRDWVKGRVYTEEREGVFIVKIGKGESASIHKRPTKKRVYLTL